MAGEAISSLILFIAAILVAAGVAGTLVTSVDELSGSIDGYGDAVGDELDTDVEIISDPGSDAVVDADGNVTVLVKNTGDRTLPADEPDLDVLVDGGYVSNDAMDGSVLDGNVWRSGTVLALEIDPDDPLDPAEHRVTVIVNGDEEVFEFYGP